MSWETEAKLCCYFIMWSFVQWNSRRRSLFTMPPSRLCRTWFSGYLFSLLNRKTTEDFCNMCWVEDLGRYDSSLSVTDPSAPCIHLACGHVFHFQCVLQTLKSRWPGPRITFNFSCCPLCKVPMAPANPISHPQLNAAFQSVQEIQEDIKKRAVNRLKFEGLDKAPEIVEKGGKFFNDPVGFSMDRFSYFVCFQCKVTFFWSHSRNHTLQDNDFVKIKIVNMMNKNSFVEDAVERIWLKVAQNTESNLSNTNVTFAAQYPLGSVGVLETLDQPLTEGTTHFCDNCHRRQLNKEYLNRKPPSSFPK